jgi:copper homeostasis protein
MKIHKNNNPPHILVEICVDTLASAYAAELGGASRIELCSALSEGGLTPSAGTIKTAVKLLSIAIHVMIRPRAGDFIYSAPEFDSMLHDIETAKQNGAEGIVTGILLPDGSVDIHRTKKLIAAAQPLPVTFHRAFDLTSDPYKSLEDIIECGCARILTSGQQATAHEGSCLIAELVKRAGKRIIIMPGSGINEKNITSLLFATGVCEVHLSGRRKITTANTINNPAGNAEGLQMHYQADVTLIHKVVEIAKSFN